MIASWNALLSLEDGTPVGIVGIWKEVDGNFVKKLYVCYWSTFFFIFLFNPPIRMLLGILLDIGQLPKSLKQGGGLGFRNQVDPLIELNFMQYLFFFCEIQNF